MLCALLTACEDDGSVNPESSEARAEWKERVDAAHAYAARKVAPTTEAQSGATPQSQSESTNALPTSPVASHSRAPAARPRSTRRPGASDGKATTPSMLVRETVSDPGGPKIVEIRRDRATAKLRHR